MNKRIIRLLKVFGVVAFLLTITVSCETTRLFPAKKVRPMSVKRLYNNVVYNYFDYETLSIKFSASVVDKGKKTSVNGMLRIGKDSIIWVSIRPMLGIELARVKLTPDSIFFINKINSTYFEGTYDYLEKMFYLDMNYFTIQSILTNRIFVYPLQEGVDESALFQDDIKHYKSSVDSGLYVLQSLKNRKLKRYRKKDLNEKIVNQDICIDPDQFYITSIKIRDLKYNRTMDLDYSDFEEYDSQELPNQIDMKVSNKNDKFDIGLKYSKVGVNKKLKYPYKRSKKYTQIK